MAKKPKKGPGRPRKYDKLPTPQIQQPQIQQPQIQQTQIQQTQQQSQPIQPQQIQQPPPQQSPTQINHNGYRKPLLPTTPPQKSNMVCLHHLF